MPELRQDPISGRWVIIAANRAGRPEEFRRAPVAQVELSCPFCRGHEDQAPPALALYGADDRLPEQWEVRVVPNKYPALAQPHHHSGKIPAPPVEVSTSGEGTSVDRPSIDGALFNVQPGWGGHEVVIESPDHVLSYSELTDLQAFWTFTAYRERLLAHRNDPLVASTAVFKNVGPEAGASLVHTHSQILFLPQAPEGLMREMAGAEHFWQQHDECVFCLLSQREQQLGVRVVAQSERFVAFCPYASRFAYETWILPRRHASHFETATDADLRDLAGLLRTTIRALERALDRPAYNYFLHTTPFGAQDCAHYHWHIELFPRVSKAAGFEWSSGWHLNAVPPERAAEVLAMATELP